jgi:hypothetical protein
MVEIIDSDATTFTVLDSINGVEWRYLTYGGSREIPRSIVLPILEGISTRAVKYNEYLEHIILEKYFDPKAELTTEQFRKQTHSISVASIRTKLIDKLTEWFSGELEKTSTIKDIKSIEVGQQTRCILEQLTGENTVKRRSPEFTLTYLMQYDAVLTTLSKTIKYKWNAIVIPPTIFQEYSKASAYDYISDMFVSLIQSVTDDMDKNRAWTAIGYSLKEYYLEYNFVY